MAFTRTWDATAPADSQQAKYGAQRIREFKVDIGERMAIEHSFAGDASDGIHTLRLGKTGITYVGTTTQINALTGMQAGAVAFDTDRACLKVYSGSAWVIYIIGVPIGVFFPYAGVTAPPGFLLCGQDVSRTTYSDLFAVIGTTYGEGDGVNTFGLPGTPGRTIIGAGTGSGLTTRALGAQVGEETHALSSAENAAHTHVITDPGHNHEVDFQQQAASDPHLNGDYVAAASYNGTVSLVGNTGSKVTGISLANSGSGTGHNNMQPSLAANFIIRY